MTESQLGELSLYQDSEGATNISVRFEGETVWLTQAQLVELFDSSKANISEHISHIFDEGELEEKSTVRNFRTVRREGSRDVERELTYYNLDMILSVGYRVKSKTATQFRIWATERLRDYLVQGYTINPQRIEELGQIVQILARSNDELVAGVAEVLADYLPGLTLLRDYDEGQIQVQPKSSPGWALTIDEARQVIAKVAHEFPGDTLFGNERGDALAGVIGAIYQGFAGQELYPTVEEKAANLLYLIIKDHPLSDGNKRSAAALFVTFLSRNGMLNDAAGRPRISNNTLAAITLMVAMSDPKEKELMIALLMRMIETDAS